jgi:hypothetical protein
VRATAAGKAIAGAALERVELLVPHDHTIKETRTMMQHNNMTLTETPISTT